MAVQEIVLQNFSGGELSEKMFSRLGLEVSLNGCRRLKNFINQTQGPAGYRNGFIHVHSTRLNQVANLIPFSFNDAQAYGVEITNKKLRFYRNNGIVLEDNVTITGISQANPGVVTATSHGYSDGDEVFINSVAGMTEVNGKSYLVANSTANTFELTDIDSNNIDTTSFTAYSSGGVANKIYEIDCPYTEALDLFQLDYDQDANTMYITHPYYLPRALTRTSDTAWTLTLQTITSDPFTDQKSISAITQADPGVVTANSHGFSDGDIVVIEEVNGMVEVNSQPYTVTNSTANTFELYDLNGNTVDTSGFTAFVSGGWASDQDLIPNAVAIYESRLWYAGTDESPDKLFASKAPDSNGDPQFNDFTVGTGADDGLQFSINSSKVNKIYWLSGTDRLLMAGTFGSLIKITGADDEQAITPTSIKARPLDRVGAENILPINKESFLLYVQRGGLTIKSIQFEALRDNFVPSDLNLVSDHITQTGGLWTRNTAAASSNGIKQLIWQTGRPDIAWAIKNDGLLIGQTFKPEEGIVGWHRHTTGASGEDTFFTVTALPRPSAFDQLWVGSERIIDGSTRRYISYMADTPVFPRSQDYFTGKDNEAADTAKYQRALLESMKEYIHLDAALTYDGRAAGIDASAAVTPGATTGTSITFTADAAVFTTDMVGRQIWKRSIDGVGTGRAKITVVNSTTSVDCDILSGADFDSTDAMGAGDWYLTTSTISGLDHLEARVVGIISDGGTESDQTVSSGAISLAGQTSVAHVGLKYEGFLQPMAVEFGGETGPSNTKIKNITKLGFRFQDTLGADVGTDLYKPKPVNFTTMPLNVGNPQYLFSGVKMEDFKDKWTREKLFYVRQPNPLPCTVQQVVVYGDAEEV